MTSNVLCNVNYLKCAFGKLLQQNQSNLTVTRTFAARKGYREIAKKKKVKTVIQKQAWIPHVLRKKKDE